MNRNLKTALIVVGVLILLVVLFGCGKPGTKPTPAPTGTKATASKAALVPPRGLTGQKPKKAPEQGQPVIVEAKPWDGTFGSDAEVQQFRTVMDEVWVDCLVNAKGGMACFQSSDAP